jgi:branched-chain amino acid aminotransferase
LKAGFRRRADARLEGAPAESTGANIFLVIDGTLVTPTPENFLDGITRRAVMGMARKRGWAVEERSVMPEELARRSEVFLSGTAAEIVPVGSVDGHHYQAGPVARTLMADFQKLVREPDCEGFGESTHLAARPSRWRLDSRGFNPLFSMTSEGCPVSARGPG